MDDISSLTTRSRRWGAGCLAVVAAMAIVFSATNATAQQRIQLEQIQIETEVPDRVARFFIARDELNYQEIDDQPTFLPDLLESVEDDPF